MQQRLGHRFNSSELLLTALTHRSYANERSIPDNERLEFLGDAVLQLVVTRHTFREYPHLREGQMTRVRAAVVRKETLAQVAEALDLGDALRLGKGEMQSGGRDKTSILADAMEALIGAVYEDGGWQVAEKLVITHWKVLIAAQAAAPDTRDAKTHLQEILAAEGKEPLYRKTEEGLSHARQFRVEVRVEGKLYGVGKGSSRRLAEQQAAAEALKELYPDAAPTLSQPTLVVSIPPPESVSPIVRRLRYWSQRRAEGKP